MARIVLSNKKEIVDNFIKHCNSVGFTKSTIVEPKTPNCNIYGAVFSKLFVDNKNVIDFGDEGFIAIVGTCFYNGILGENALKQMYDDYKAHRNICKIRQQMNGSFLLAISFNGCLSVISDAAGVFFAYYHIDVASGLWVLGTSLYELVKSSSFECEVDEHNLMEECYQHCILGDDTIFNEYKKLTGDNYFEVDLKSNIAKVVPIENAPKFSIDERPIDVLVEETAAEYSKLAQTICDNFSSDDIAICMTGGIDARTTMAALLSKGMKPSMYYGIGNSPLTNTTLGDLDVNKIYAEKFGLRLNLIDWKTPEKIDESWDKYIDKYGTLASMYSASSTLYQSLESIKEPIVFIGCVGELYRNDYEVEQKKEQYFPIEQVVKQCYLGCDMQALMGNDYQKYVNHIKEKICSIMSPYIEDGKIDKKYIVILKYQMWRLSDTIVVNFMNQQRYSMSMFTEPAIIKYAMIPTEYKDNSRFIIKTLNAIYSPILEVPIYSRHQWRTIDWKKMQLAYQPTSMIDYYKALFFRNSRLGRWVRKILYPFYVKRNERRRVKKGQIKEDNYIPLSDIALQLVHIFKQFDFFHRNTNPLSSGYVPKDAHLAILLTAMRKLHVRFSA